MRTIDRNHHRFQRPLRTTTGTQFQGTIFTIDRTPGMAGSFIETRLILRVRPETPVSVGSVVYDEMGRTFLMAEHGQTPGEKTFRLFDVQGNVSWKRASTINDVVTGLPKTVSETELGPIWAALETYGQERTDLGLRLSEEKRRVITGSQILLNDRVDNALVRRVWSVFGIQIGEIQ